MADEELDPTESGSSATPGGSKRPRRRPVRREEAPVEATDDLAAADDVTDEDEAAADATEDEPTEDESTEDEERPARGSRRPVRKGSTAIGVADENADEDDAEPTAGELAKPAGRQRKNRPTPKQKTDDAADKRTTPGVFIGQSIAELRKVVWPTGDQMRGYFAVVLVFVVFIIAFVSLLDLAYGWLILKAFG